ncbi:1246_t:CDS:2 [Ambispora gerdemannii]|uniref:1246_t:CDS:1 n=1 Tax=Ambispora gerdemannii TaxID=144530 RepID=A0A9N9FJR5_9GLOM|nr:1246_t:CDS:2 [Ambispora gerdemannii]
MPLEGQKIANPGPLGLSAFALTTFVLSLYNVNAGGVTHPNIVVGLALFYGGLVQLLAGMWEFKTGNTFGATAFSSYGGFWLSYAAILIPGFNAVGSFSGDKTQLENALGIYLLGWTIFTFLLFLATFRLNGGLVALFFCLTTTFLLLALAKFAESENVEKAGGVFGIITAFIAWYVALSGLLTQDTAYFTLPLYDLGRKAK